VYFSNVRFLREVKDETASRSRLKHLLVLAARLLALAFLVLAFARPYLSEEGETPKGPAKVAGLYIDNSFSMDAPGEEISLLEQAREEAASLVKSFEPDVRFLLLTNHPSSGNQLLTREETLNELAKIRLTPETLTLDQIRQRMKSGLPEGKVIPVYLFSDFQTSITDLKPDSTLDITLVPLHPAARTNISIDSAVLDAPVFLLNRSNRMLVYLHNYGESDAEQVPVWLFLNGERKAISQVSIPAGSSATDTIVFTFPQNGWNTGWVEIQDAAVHFDDTLYLNFYVKPILKALVLNGGPAAAYFSALNDPELFLVDQIPVTRVDYSSLADYDLIALNQVASTGSGLADALEEYILSGGNLCVFPGYGNNVTALNDFLRKLSPVHYEPLLESGDAVKQIVTGHGLFENVFEQIPEQVKLPSVKRYYRIKTGSTAEGEPLMTLGSGDPFLYALPAGKGMAYLFATALDPEFTDLPRSAFFAVSMIQMAALRSGQTNRSLTVGKEQTARIRQAISGDEVLHLTNSHTDILPPQRLLGREVLISTGKFIRQAGNYAVSLKDNEIIDYLSFNYDRTESKTGWLSNATLAEKYIPMGYRVIDPASASVAAVAGEARHGKSLWKLCLIFALVFLGIEIAFLRLLPG